ncbi:MAG: GNAT family N-acetyltransferase [Candidatus Thorarchaeota archaeon]|nr:GNAT family N-acetyltransferase [Candidatus Thorarchaeota archaeon]
MNPNYQGQGYGKYMLIEASEIAAKLGKRRIDLHTWGGNLKAMPLYKRTGYNWVPNTRVLMESHIPGIIGCPMFSDFFAQHDWYDSLKIDIKQEMDDIVEDEIGVFKYHFEGENGDSLDVTIDREAKGICGFSLTMNGKTISASIRPRTHIGYIGIGKYPVDLKILNNNGETVSYSVQVKSGDGLMAHLDGAPSGQIEDAGWVNLDGFYEVTSNAVHLDREIIPDDKIATQAEWNLTIDNKTMSLFSGLIPTDAVTISLGPDFSSISPGEIGTIGVSLRNNTKDAIRGEAVLTPPLGRRISVQRIRFTLKPDETFETPLDIHTSKEENGVIVPIKISVHIDQEGKTVFAKRATMNIPIIGSTGAVAYKAVNDFFVIENENIRVLLNGILPHVIRRIRNKNLEIPHSGWSLLPEIGYPFPRGGSEWERKKFDVSYVNNQKYAEVKLTGESEERPGLFMTISYRIYAGREDLEIITKLENSGTQAYENLGIKIGGWLPFMGQILYLPLDEKIYKLDNVNWFGGRQLPKDPNRYHESWAASELSYGRGVLGFIWHEEGISDIRIMRQWNLPRVEYKLPNLDPGSSTELPLMRLMVSQGDWRKVRSLWARLNGKTLPIHVPPVMQSDLEIGFVHVGADSKAPLMPTIMANRGKSTKVEFRANVLQNEPVSCEVRISLPEGFHVDGKREIEFSVEKTGCDDPIIHPLNVTVENGSSWIARDGEILLRFTNRVERRPLIGLIYDTSVETKRTNEKIGTRTLHTVHSGSYRMGVSPDYRGSLVHFGEKGKESLFMDTFPETKPFIWNDKHYSGFNPRLIGMTAWDWLTGLQKEEWSIREKDVGQWTGYELESRFKHANGLKGILFKVQYLLLKGTPLVYVRLAAENRSGTWKEFRLGFHGVPKPGGVPQSQIHGVVNHQRILYEPTPSDNSFYIDPEEGWSAYKEPESGLILGFVSTTKTSPTLEYENSGDKGQWATIDDRRRLSANDSTSLSGYILQAEQVEDVEALKNMASDLE